MRDFSLYSNEELLELACQRHLIHQYHLEGAHVVLYLEEAKLKLTPPQIRTFLNGLLWGTRDAAPRLPHALHP